MLGAMTEARRRRRTLSAAALLALSLASPFARAGGNDTEAKSRKLFEQAEGLGNDGRWREACLLYQAAHDLNGTGGTALRAGDCYEKINDVDRAIVMYRWVVDHRAGDKHPERVAIAEQRLVMLQRLKAAQQAPVQQRGPVRAAPPPPPVPNRVPAAVSFAVGGASLVTGVVLLTVAGLQAQTVNKACGTADPCPLTHQADFDAANAKAWASMGMFSLAGVGVAAGALMWALQVPKTSVVRSALGPQGITLRF